MCADRVQPASIASTANGSERARSLARVACRRRIRISCFGPSPVHATISRCRLRGVRPSSPATASTRTDGWPSRLRAARTRRGGARRVAALTSSSSSFSSRREEIGRRTAIQQASLQRLASRGVIAPATVPTSTSGDASMSRIPRAQPGRKRTPTKPMPRSTVMCRVDRSGPLTRSWTSAAPPSAPSFVAADEVHAAVGQDRDRP